MKKIMLPILIVQILVCIGCSDNVSLKGRVTFSDDGSPVSSGTVCFVTDTFQARGNLDSGGYYSVGTTGTSNGLPLGTYKVFIADAKKQTGTKKVIREEIDKDSGETKSIEVDDPVLEELVDPKFNNAETSGLTVEVKSSTKFNFTVDRFKP
ncbi:MAG: hypothetical protein LBT09_15730 [Planctomycetaceae bacterium]|jgi:hypothetical protein|nr:hypothetical protein [Planctomycetaceae bacterium]